MKAVDNNGKLFGKVNLVDVGIVLLLVLAVAAVGAKIAKEKVLGKESAVIRYTLLAEGVRRQSVDAINKSYEKVVDAENEDELGKIVDVKVEKAKKLVELPDGTFKESEYPDKFDLYVTVETNGTVSKNGYFTDSGKKLLYGDTIGINNGYSQMFGMIEKIEVK